MAETGGLNFKVVINEMIANTNTDIVVKGRDGSSIPWYGDSLVMMNGRKVEGKRDLLIRLQSNEEFMDGPLTGFEIFKLSNHDNSLASPNPLPPSKDSKYQTIQTLLSDLGYRNAIGTVAMTIISIASIIVHKLREALEASSNEEEHKPSARAERLCRRFSLAEIQLATRNFSDGLVIGRGGFGKVYKGLIDGGQRFVAIKRLKSNSSQGAREFLTEIETLSELRHVNLVSLIGYCSERREMILVYEYMPNGTLADHLYKHARESNNCSSLDWKQRLNICIGAARGLDYLHTGQGVIHRDVKASNILLDENFIANVSDFGLAKPEDKSKLQSHVSTKVKGTYGYFDPYYFCTRKLTRKSDTYAFGVMLLEVLCGRAAVDSAVSEDERILTIWARYKISKGEVDQIVSSSLRDEISPNSLKIFVGVAKRCLHDEPKNRPTMSQVVLQLEYALEQQDNNQNLVLDEIASVPYEIHPSTSNDEVQHNLALPTDEQTDNVNAEQISGHRRRSTRNTPSRLNPWNAIWNILKPSRRNESLLLEQESWEADIKLAKFDWDTIAAATNNFSKLNIVGHYSFGRVYKAVLPSGEVVAVERPFNVYNIGEVVVVERPFNGYDVAMSMLLEFRNVVILLPDLRHRNIIKLLGYCSHREKRLLVYEFIESTSLHHFIDKEQEQQQLLEWALRFKIILGIARGLVYLHHDSGVRVIHRNLSSRNILLDGYMNPKISDFGNARTLLEHQTELEPSRISGTYGYMCPEYLMHGKLSIKTDVYSFGVILLEIVSGRRMFSHHREFEARSHVEPVWKLWNERRALDLVDESLGSEFREDEVLRCIQVALLCIQEHPCHRPSMPCVVQMLEGYEPLMQPRPPVPISDGANIDGVNSNATFELER